MKLLEKYMNGSFDNSNEFLNFLNEFEIDEELFFEIFNTKGEYVNCIDLKQNNDIDIVEQLGGEGTTMDKIHITIYHKKLNTYFKTTGYYDSWNGSNLSEWKIVNPVKRLVTEYESNHVEDYYIVENFLDQKYLSDDDILKLLNELAHDVERVFDKEYVVDNYVHSNKLDERFQRKYNVNMWQKYVTIVIKDIDKIVVSSKLTGQLFRANVESKMNDWSGYEFSLSNWYKTESYRIEKTFYK